MTSPLQLSSGAQRSTTPVEGSTGPHTFNSVLGKLSEYVETVKTKLNAGQTERFLTIADQLHAHHLVYETSTRKFEQSSSQLYELHGSHIRQYLEERYAFLASLSSSASTPCEEMSRSGKSSVEGESSFELLIALAHEWTRFKLLNKWMFKLFWYLNRFYVPHQGAPTLQQSGTNLFCQLIMDRLGSKLKDSFLIYKAHLPPETLLFCGDAFQAASRADDSTVEAILDLVLFKSATVDKSLHEHALSILARHTDRDGLGRLLELPQCLAKLVQFATAPTAGETVSTIRTSIAQILLNLSESPSNRPVMIKRFPAINLLLQSAIAEPLRSDIGSLSLKALRNLGCCSNRVKCLQLMTVLCLAGDELHGLQSRFYVIPTALYITIHETLCPFGKICPARSSSRDIVE